MRDSKVVAAFKRQRRRTDTVACDVCGWAPPAILSVVRGSHVAGMMHGHHVVPVARGGDDAVANLALLCPTCHALAHGCRAAHLGPRTPAELVEGLRLLRADPSEWWRREYALRRQREREMGVPRSPLDHPDYRAARDRLHRRLALHSATQGVTK